MIFGFNTDIRHDGVVYHVQSEVRQHEHVLQTQVFVRGRCIGKRASGFATEQDETQLHELLKEQHRYTVNAIRSGEVSTVFDSAEPNAKSSPSNVVVTSAPATNDGMNLEWTGAEANPASNLASLRFRLCIDQAPAANATFVAHLDVQGREATRVETGGSADGTTEIVVPLDQAVTPGAILTVEASHCTRVKRFRFRLCCEP